MKRYTTLFCTLAVAGGLTSVSLAADYGNTSGNNVPNAAPNATSPAMTPTPGTSAAPASPEITGTVQKVDATNSRLKVKDDKGTVQMVKVDSTTQIIRNGNPVQLAELHKGDVIVIKNAGSTM